jgi:hypothetical protein
MAKTDALTALFAAETNANPENTTSGGQAYLVRISVLARGLRHLDCYELCAPQHGLRRYRHGIGRLS